MRSCWRLLRGGSYNRFKPLFFETTRYFLVHSSSASQTSSELFALEFLRVPLSLAFRGFSSASLEGKNCVLRICDEFEKDYDLADVDRTLGNEGVLINEGVVLDVLKSLYTKPTAARKFYTWVLEKDAEKMSARGYNLMLEILCSSELVDDFWDLVAVMNNKGLSIFRAARDKAAKMFEKHGRDSDLRKLNEMFSLSSGDEALEKVGVTVSRIIRNRVWGPEVEDKIRSLDLELSSDVLTVILDNLVMEPMRALIFFRWVEEIGKHDGKSYNAMARVLGREDCIDRFWKIIDEMKTNGVEMELRTYYRVLDRFVKRKMMKDAVNLTEFAMTGQSKPSVDCCTFLLKKIASAKEFDIELFSQLVKVLAESSIVLTSSMLNAVIKSMTSSGRLGECNRVVVELMEAGLILDCSSQRKIAFALSCKGMEDKASEFVNYIEASGTELDEKALISVIKGYCKSGYLDKAHDFFRDNFIKFGTSNACYALDLLVSSFCCKNRALEVFKFLQSCVDEYQLKPRHETYKTLIKNLLLQGCFHEALHMLHMMRKNEYSTFVDPFIEYVSKSGTENEAVAFVNATSSTSIALRTVQAFFNIGKYDEAQQLLSKCDRHIRNSPGILTFLASSRDQGDATTPVAA